MSCTTTLGKDGCCTYLHGINLMIHSLPFNPLNSRRSGMGFLEVTTSLLSACQHKTTRAECCFNQTNKGEGGEGGEVGNARTRSLFIFLSLSRYPPSTFKMVAKGVGIRLFYRPLSVAPQRWIYLTPAEMGRRRSARYVRHQHNLSPFQCGAPAVLRNVVVVAREDSDLGTEEFKDGKVGAGGDVRRYKCV